MSHSAVITDDGDVYTFGANQFGQLGHGSDAPNNMPHKVMALHDKPVLFVACGDTFTVAATKGLRLNRVSFYISLTCGVVVVSDSEVFTWGKSARGRLGRSEHESNVPKKVAIGDDEPFLVTSVSCSHGNTLIATKSNT